MSDFNPKIEAILTHSLDAIRAYQKLIQSQSSAVGGTSSQRAESRMRVLQNLINSLENTRSILSKEIENNRFVRIDPELAMSMNKAFDQLMSDKTTENKVNLIHFALYGANVPFWTILRDVQNLLYTVEGLKAETRKVSKIEASSKKKKKK